MGKFFQVERGSTRTVILVGKYAIKIPLFESFNTLFKGLTANNNERRMAHTAPKYFIPVLFSIPGLLVVMPRARVCSLPNWMVRSFMADIFHPSNDECDEAKTARMYCEYINANYGMYKGKPMCIDYGTYLPPIVQREDMKREYDLMDWDIRDQLGIVDESKSSIQMVQESTELSLVRLDIPTFIINAKSQSSDDIHEVDVPKEKVAD